MAISKRFLGRDDDRPGSVSAEKNPESPEGRDDPESADSLEARNRDRLFRAVLREVPTMDSHQVEGSVQTDMDDIRRLWRALGFPDSAGQPAYTAHDVEALRGVERLVGYGLDMDTLVRMTRGVGTTMSRLADWQVGTMLTPLDPAYAEVDRRGQELLDMLERIMPTFEALLLYAFRRHLAAAAARTEELAMEEEAQVIATTGFADMVGFTALSNELNEDEIGDLVEVFESRAHDVIAENGGRIIKSLGDSVLFVTEAPSYAVEIALGIIGVIGKDSRLPDVRVGLSTGPVIQRMGDVYGPPVNLASRLTAVARRNRVIIDEQTASVLPLESYETRPLPMRPIRGFGELVPWTVRRTRPRHRG